MSSHIQMFIPAKDELASWVRLLDESRWMDIHEMIHLHKMLHATFGTAPNDAVLEGERKLSAQLRSFGIEHRHKDALSEAAGTAVTDLAPPTLEEVRWFLHDIVVHSGIVRLSQGVDTPTPIFAIIDETMLPEGSAKTVLKQINKMMPPGVTIKAMPKKPREEFLREMRVYDLELASVRRLDVMVVPWKQVVAEAPKLLLKSDEAGNQRFEITANIAHKRVTTLKSGEEKRYVLGPVLLPEVEDTQNEIYSAEEVEKACHWWARNSRILSQKHMLQGGKKCEDHEMEMVENYCLPVDCEIGGVELKKGTWMMGAIVDSDTIWRDMQAGRINCWSMGAEVLAGWEEVQTAAA